MRSAGGFLLLACDPGWSLEGTVALADRSVFGGPLLVQVFEDAELDAAGLPAGRWPPRVAPLAGEPSYAFEGGNLGCEPSVFAGGSSGLEARPADGSFIRTSTRDRGTIRT